MPLISGIAQSCQAYVGPLKMLDTIMSNDKGFQTCYRPIRPSVIKTMKVIFYIFFCGIFITNKSMGLDLLCLIVGLLIIELKFKIMINNNNNKQFYV